MNRKFFSVLIGNKINNNYDDNLQIISPINGKIIGIIPKIKTKEQVDKIFENAKECFYFYRDTSLVSRKEKLLKFCDLLEKNREEIANIIVWEIAKNKKDSYEEIDRSISYIKQTIIEYEKIMNNPLIIDETKHNIKGKIGTFIYEPIGVVLAISPFNYPLNLLISKIAPALISGNSVVYKPATQGSCVGAFISTLFYEAGFINGEVNCIIGKGSEIGRYIIDNKNIGMISFTGSTNIGKEISEKNPLIPIVLELGGKDAAIVLEDADIENAAKRIILGAFSYNGQRCTGIKRVLVDKKIEFKLLEALNKELEKLNVGSAIYEKSDITEMINFNSIKYNLELILDAINKGAGTYQKVKKIGNILYPMILFNVSLDSRIAWEEQFGPVLPIISFDNLDVAIDIHNSSQYGLQASIFTKNIDLAKRISKFIEAGTININRASSRGPDIFPFSGVKDSAKGLQGIKFAILSMNRIKGVVENND